MAISQFTFTRQVTPTTTSGINSNGPAAELNKNPYNTTVYKYPEDIGSGSIPSYVVFDIYSPLSSSVSKTSSGQAAQAMKNSRSNMDLQSIQAKTSLAQPIVDSNGNVDTPAAIGAIATGVDAAARSMYTAWMANHAAGPTGTTVSVPGATLLSGLEGVVGAAAANFGATNLINLNPRLYRTTTSIMIYMPDTMKVDYEHTYNEVDAEAAFAQVGLNSAMGKSLADVPRMVETQGPLHAVQGLAQSAYGREMITGILEEIGFLGQGARGLSLKSAGYAVNPQTELLYKGTKNREFELTFMFQPRSTVERDTIKNIITAFKVNAAPSVDTKNSSSGRYFIVPNQFDIRFMFRTSENQYVSKVSTCVLQSMRVDYAGSGEWVTMEDGAPASILLQLWFKESEIMYRELIQQGGY